MRNKEITIQFTVLTFCIAYLVSGVLIVLSQFGYTVYNWVDTSQQFISNIPFAIYILSPAIASYIVLKKNDKVTGIKKWLRTVFYVRNGKLLYLYVCALLAAYFMLHFTVADNKELAMPFDTFFLSLCGNLVIGGLEEAGWMYILQPELDKKYGYVPSSLIVGVIWLLWHVPLFFIAGTNHGEGLIDFGMFSFQVMAFRFVYGAIYKLSGVGGVFMCVLFHTMFNALSPIFSTVTATWPGTLLANSVMIIISIVTVTIYKKRSEKILS